MPATVEELIAEMTLRARLLREASDTAEDYDADLYEAAAEALRRRMTPKPDEPMTSIRSEEPSEKEIGMVSRGAEHSGPADRRLEAQHSEGSQLRYRGYDIYPTDPVPPIPGWQKVAWTWAHKDYDGPEDGRCGCAESVAACKAEIDEREGEYPEGWTNAQAAKCPCRGSDDYCLCISEYWPERYGLTETEKCEDCGRLASDLTHRFCQQPDCPVRAMLAAQHPRADFDAQPSGADYRPRAIHYEAPDYLEYVAADVPTVAEPITAEADRLLDLKSREPVGWRIYGWSRLARGLQPSGAWRPIDENTPRDGTLFLGCNLDHPSFGSWVMYRRVRHAFDDEGNAHTEDLGGWVIIHDLRPDYQEGSNTGPDPDFAIAQDEFNRSVRYGWMPLPAPPPDNTASNRLSEAKASEAGGEG